MLSWSWKPFVPFDFSTPSTVELTPFELDRLPDGITAAEQIRDDRRADHDDRGWFAASAP